MEKDNAEEANTEFDNSVTSEEQGSLAENEEKSNEKEVVGEVIETPKEASDLANATTEISLPKESEDPITAEEPVAEKEPLPEVTTTDDLAEEPKEEVVEEDKPNEPEVESTTDESVDSGDEELLKKDAAEAVEAKDDTNIPAKEIKEEATEETITRVEDITPVEAAADPQETEVAEAKDEAAEAKDDTIIPAKEIKEEATEETIARVEDITPVEAAADPQEREVTEANDEVAEAKDDTNIPVKEIKEDNKQETIATEEGQSPEKTSDDSSETEAAKEKDEAEEWQDVDFTTFSKEELVEVIKKLGKYENPFKADKILQLIAPLFNKMRAEDREIALKKFIDEGGVADDFQYRTDELSLRFDANYKLIKDKKSKKFKEQGHERTKNLLIAEEVLEELRSFVDSEESTASFNQFKIIQRKWKEVGDVPAQNSKNLWANYNALVHRFYDQRSIYFELKELDRRKNYETKLVLCEKAEALENEKNLREAIKGLNDLHYEYKHLGPVPQDLQEELWQRFKAASDKVYEKRKEYVIELKATLNENLVKKQELVEEIKVFLDFQSDRIKEWNEKTKELVQLQKTWDSVGGLPKDKAKQINKEFWSSFKKFFSNKHQFFKKMDAGRDANLVKKQELVDQAIALKESENWQETANAYKKLQNEWREIGPVPEKMRNKIYQEFKSACDYFFDKRREGHKSSLDSYKANLSKKKELIEKIKDLKATADANLDEFNTTRKQFLEVGYVPKKNIDSIKKTFQEAIEDFLGEVTVLNEKQKTEISLEAEFSNLAGSDHSDKELYQKEQAVRRHINKLEDDIALWRNNLEFFAHSKSTDKLRKDVNGKIEIANSQLEGLKRQLKMLRSL